MAKSKMAVYVRARQEPNSEAAKKAARAPIPLAAEKTEEKAPISEAVIKDEVVAGKKMPKAPKENRSEQISEIVLAGAAPKKHSPVPDESVDEESTEKLGLGTKPEMPPSAEFEVQSNQTRLDVGQGQNPPLTPTSATAPDAAKQAADAQTIQSSIQSSVLDPLRVLEAALFMSPQSLPAADLGKLVGIASVGHVGTLLSQLGKQYDATGSSLEVVEENPGKWTMRIRASFAPTVRRFAGEAEIPKHALRTLAYISRHEGITKRDLFRRLGGTIYEDTAELLEKGFVSAKPSGRTMALTTTAKFKQYFTG